MPVVQFAAYQPIAKVGDFKGQVIGTLRSIAKGTKLGFTNFTGSKQLQVLLKAPNGDSATIICSPAVSRLYRSKEISVGNLLTFMVEERKASDGSIINVICKPATSGATIDVDNVADEQWVPNQFEGA